MGIYGDDKSSKATACRGIGRMLNKKRFGVPNIFFFLARQKCFKTFFKISINTSLRALSRVVATKNSMCPKDA